MPRRIKSFEEKLADALVRGGNVNVAKQTAKRYSADIQRIYAGQGLTPKEAANIAMSFRTADAGNKYRMQGQSVG